MTSPNQPHGNRFSKFFIPAFFITACFCLALIISAFVPAPAQANDQCENRAYLNAPIEKLLAALPHVSKHENALFSVAMSKNYALLGWRHEHILRGTYYFAVGTFTTDSSGRKAIAWNLADAYKLTTRGGVSEPSMAINDKGNVIIAIEDPVKMVAWMACKVTTSNSGGPRLSCGEYHDGAYQGGNPSVSLNLTATGEEQAVLAYEGWFLKTLFYRAGFFNDSSLSVDWSSRHHYTFGDTPMVAMNNLGDVVEVHFNALPFTHHIYYKLGTFDSAEKKVHFHHSHKYECYSEPFPTVAITDKALVEFQQRAHDFKLYYRYGTFNTSTGRVNWQGGTEKHQIGSNRSFMPWVAVNSQGDLLMAWKDWEKGPSSHVFGGVGKLGYGWACPWPTVTTDPVSHITGTSAQSGGEVTIEGDGPVTARGVCWSTSQNPTIDDDHTNDGTRFGPFTSRLSGLSPDTTYYVRAYATNAYGTGYGEQMSFHSGKILPKVWTLPPLFIKTNSAWAGGAVIRRGEGPVTDRGLCWSTSPNPTLNDPNLSKGSGLGAYYAKIEGLDPDTTYYVRAYATNRGGTSYGASLRFTTAHPSLPTVQSSDPSNLTASSAVLGGDVTSQGSSPVSERGVVWATTPQPNLNNHRVPMGGGLGPFGQEVGGLSAETTYYMRAYAINSAGVVYGAEKRFATTAGDLPVVSTTAPYGETEDTALSGGYVANGGQTPVTARGVCWSTSPNPDISGSHTNDGDGTGEFHSVMSGLSPETTYYVRAYATNSAGTAYGEQYSFNTIGSGYPEVETLDIVELNVENAKVSGDVVADGGATVETRGVCWSTSPNPSLDDNVVDSGSGLGKFEALISGLSLETVYYARAFATNQNGTSYGHVVTFRNTFCPYPCR